MQSIKTSTSNELEIKKSKFITYAYYISDKLDIKPIIDSLKKQHHDARHICYAYICNNDGGYNDDGEPSKTAGYPMLEVLRLKNITNVLIVCVRYFGGIKLGSGGLIRAYAQSATQVLNQAQLVDISLGSEYQLIVELKKINQILFILNSYKIAIIKKKIEQNMELIIHVANEIESEVIGKIKSVDYTIQCQKKKTINVIVSKEKNE